MPALELSLVASLLLQAGPQAPFPKPGADPTGVVVAEDGTRIAGARVTLRFDPVRSRPWSLAIQQVLRATPLPSATSDRDGEFVLPLTRDQRLLGLAGEGSFSLVVEKPGFQSWNEPLPGGLDGYLGSRAVLVAPRESDTVTVVVEDPEAGMALTIERWERGELDVPERVPVPADGRVSVQVPLLPSPPPRVEATRFQPVGLVAQIWRGGSAGATKLVAQGAETRWPRAEWSAAAAAKTGAPASRSAPAPRPPDPFLGSVLVRARDTEGRPVVGAVVLCNDVADREQSDRRVPLLDQSQRGPFAGAVLHTDAHGEARIAELPAADAQLRIRVLADGAYFDDAAPEVRVGAETTIEMTALPSQRFHIWTVGREQAAQPFATLQLGQQGDMDRQRSPRPRSALVSDSLGRIAVTLATETNVFVRRDFVPGAAPLEAGTEPQRIELDPEALVLVRIPMDAEVIQFAWSRKTAGGSGGFRLTPGACGALVSLAEGDPQAGIVMTLASGPPIRVRAEELAKSPRSHGVAIVDRSRIARRIPLLVRGHDGKPIERLSVAFEPSATKGGLLPGPGRNNQRVAPLVPGAGGSWTLTAYDPDPIEAALLSPEHLLFPLSLDARGADGKETPIEVDLVPGAPLALRLVPKEFAMPTGAVGMWSIGLTSVDDPTRVERHRFDYGKIGKEQHGKPLTITCERAFPPGKYRLKVYLGRTQPEREVELEVGKLTVVDLTGPEGTAASRKSEGR